MEPPSTSTQLDPPSPMAEPDPNPNSDRAPPLPPPPGRPPRPPPPPPHLSNLQPQSEITVDTAYIVHVPKDQIYRVPPPENTDIARMHRTNHENKGRQRNPCVNCLCWLFGALLVLGIVVLVSCLVVFLVVRPGPPNFTVERLSVTGPKKNPVYKFTLRSRNPSYKMGYSYTIGGEAILAYQNVVIARGGTPGFSQRYKNVKEFELELNGLRMVLPKVIERSLNGSREIVSLSLSVNFPVKIKISELRLWRMRLGVACDVKASGLGKNTRVVPQTCKEKLHFLNQIM